MKQHKHRALRPLTYRKSLSMARQFGAIPGYADIARKHKARAISLATTEAERAKAMAVEITSAEHEGT